MVAGGSIWSSPRAEFSNGNLYIGSHWGNTGSGNSHVYKFNPAGGGSFSQKVFTDKVSDLKVAQDTLYLAGNDNMGALYIQKYHYNTDSTLWITRGDSVNNSGSYISIAHDPSGGVIFQAVMSVGAGTHFDHVPIPTDYFKNPLFGKLNRNGRLEWFNQPQRVVVGTPTHMVAVKGMAFCLGQYNWTFFPESDTADFGPFQLWPYNGDNWGHEYLVALDLMDGIQLEINLPDTITVCSGASQTLPTLVSGGTGNYSYRWRNGKWTMDDSTAAAPVVMPWQDTNYYVEVSDGFRTAVDSIRIEVPGNYFPLDADSVHWDFGDGTMSNAYWPYHEYAGSGIFEVKLYLENICGASTFSDTIERCDSAFSPVVTTNGNYSANFSWNATGASSYNVWFRLEGDTAWSRVNALTNSRSLTPIAPGNYEYFISESGNTNSSCIGNFTINCEDFGYSVNTFQIVDATKGKINVFGINGGRRTWDFGLDNGTDTVWANDRFSNRFIQLQPGNYNVLVKDHFDCYSNQITSVTINDVHSSTIPVRSTVQNLGGGSLRPVWTVSDPSRIDRYQIRVKNMTGGGLGTLYQTYIALGETTTSFIINGLPPARYRLDVRGRVDGAFTNGTYSNYRERVVSSNKDETTSLTDLSEENQSHQQPTLRTRPRRQHIKANRFEWQSHYKSESQCNRRAIGFICLGRWRLPARSEQRRTALS